MVSKTALLQTHATSNSPPKKCWEKNVFLHVLQCCAAPNCNLKSWETDGIVLAVCNIWAPATTLNGQHSPVSGKGFKTPSSNPCLNQRSFWLQTNLQVQPLSSCAEQTAPWHLFSNRKCNIKLRPHLAWNQQHSSCFPSQSDSERLVAPPPPRHMQDQTTSPEQFSRNGTAFPLLCNNVWQHRSICTGNKACLALRKYNIKLSSLIPAKPKEFSFKMLSLECKTEFRPQHVWKNDPITAKFAKSNCTPNTTERTTSPAMLQ